MRASYATTTSSSRHSCEPRLGHPNCSKTSMQQMSDITAHDICPKMSCHPSQPHKRDAVSITVLPFCIARQSVPIHSSTRINGNDGKEER